MHGSCCFCQPAHLLQSTSLQAVAPTLKRPCHFPCGIQQKGQSHLEQGDFEKRQQLWYSPLADIRIHHKCYSTTTTTTSPLARSRAQIRCGCQTTTPPNQTTSAHRAIAALGTPSLASSQSCMLPCRRSAGMLGRKYARLSHSRTLGWRNCWLNWCSSEEIAVQGTL